MELISETYLTWTFKSYGSDKFEVYDLIKMGMSNELSLFMEGAADYEIVEYNIFDNFYIKKSMYECCNPYTIFKKKGKIIEEVCDIRYVHELELFYELVSKKKIKKRRA